MIDTRVTKTLGLVTLFLWYMRLLYTIIAIYIATTLVGCGNSAQQGNEESATSTDNTSADTTASRRYFEADFNPARISSREEYLDAINRYWDNFDFEADSLVANYDTLSIIQAFADYVVYIEPEHADSLLRNLMHRAESSRPVLNIFSDVARTVLNDPNSPLRNDEYYIPILEVLIASPLLDEYERIAPAYDLDIARKNRLDSIANDFVYTLADGSAAHMHDIDADYLLIMISNPGCPSCKQLIAELSASPLINELIDCGSMKIMSIYPDGDIDAWRAHIADMPTSWINGYDADMHISRKHLYDLRAIPALYLLDKEKRVLIKDGTNVAHVEYIISQ